MELIIFHFEIFVLICTKVRMKYFFPEL